MTSFPFKLLEGSGMLPMLRKIACEPGISEKELFTRECGLNGAMAKHERLRMLSSLGLVELEIEGEGWDKVLIRPMEQGLSAVSEKSSMNNVQ